MATLPTVPALPTAVQNAQAILAAMAALNGVLTDYNVGSIIRTTAESLGYVIEEQGAELVALAFQSIVYGAFAAYGIVPLSATASTGTVTFLTSTSSSPPPASQTVTIPAGTVVQTVGGTQFQTASTVNLTSGSTSVSVGVISLVPGAGSNVPASSIVQIANGLSYPLFVLNNSPTNGGAAAEPFSQTAGRFAAAVALPGLASPLAVADAAIGVTYSGTGEIVQYSSCWESGITSGIAGFILYIDNGTGTASSGLVTAVQNFLNSGVGHRPVGVPYQVQPGSPIYASVNVTAGLYPQYEGTNATIVSLITSAVENYFTLPFAGTAYQGQIAAVAGNAAIGQLDSLTVILNSGVTYVSAGPGNRIIPQSVSVSVL
jgi:Baseplate J-like protein